MCIFFLDLYLFLPNLDTIFIICYLDWKAQIHEISLFWGRLRLMLGGVQ